MSGLVELLSDLAILESTPSNMDRCAMSLLCDIKEQLDEFYANLIMSANLAVASRHTDQYSTVSLSKLIQTTLGTTNLIRDHRQDPAHYNEFGSLSQSPKSSYDSMHAPSLQANPALGVSALDRSSEFRSVPTDANIMQANPNENEIRTESRFEITNGDHNALNQGLHIPQLTDTALERPAATGPCYLSANNFSTSSLTSAGLSTIPLGIRENTTLNKHVFPGASSRISGENLVSNSAMFNSSAGPSNSAPAIRQNATQMKRALSEASSRIAAGGAHKKAKGDMDPVGVPQPPILLFERR